MPKFRVNVELSVTRGTAIIEADTVEDALAMARNMTSAEIVDVFDIATDSTYEVVDAWEEDDA